MARFKFMSLLMLLLVIAGGGVTAFSQAPVCLSQAGPPLALCDGTDMPLNLGGCNWWQSSPTAGLVWSNVVVRREVAGTDQVASNVVACYTTTPIITTFYPIRKCNIYGSTCIGGWGTCTDYAAGTPVVTSVTTYYTVPCPPVVPEGA